MSSVRRPRLRAALTAAACLLGALAVLPVAAGPAAADANPMVFPVAGGASWSDTFGAPRSGGRTHAGQDLFAPKMRPLVAAADGVVARMGRDSGISGNYVVIRDAEGWEYLYIHVNNDRPGTDDGANLDLDAFPPGIRPGAKVWAGQTIGYMGDSGNAETTPPHLHFEIRTPDKVSINPATRLRSAVHRTLAPQTIQAHSPFGSYDSAALDPAGFHLSGWAIDPDSDLSLTVEVYVDRELSTTLSADRPRADLAAHYPGKGTLHGFSATVAVPSGTHDVCVAARNDGFGPATMLRCRTVARSTSPIGSLDSVRRVPGALRLTGWAIDPDTASPIEVHGYVGDAGAGTTASRARSDVGAVYPRFGPNHGYEVLVPVTPGNHDVCAYGINTGSGGNAALRCQPVAVSSDPLGRVDSLAASPTHVSIKGWALDPDTAGAIEVHVYVDGVGTNLGLASQQRSDVAAAYRGWGAAHGFGADIPVPNRGEHQICAYAINTSHGSTTSLGCRTVTTSSSAPIGALDQVSRTADDQLRVSGWAIDPDTTNPVDVHLYVGDQGYDLGPAFASRPDVGGAYPGYGNGHGFARTVPIPAGPTTVCAYALDQVGNDGTTRLGCRTV